jgi:hypothetical protein
MIAKGRDGGDMVKVVDFGIAKAHTSEAQKVTKTGLVVGTPEYMSPEQLAGDKLDGRSDIYSLALVGFNMLTGQLPFPSNSAQEAMIMRLTENPKRLADMRPDVAWTARLQSVMDKALARDAAARYQSAAEFGRDFSMAIAAMPAPTDARTIAMSAQEAPTPVSNPALPPTRVSVGADHLPPGMRESAAKPVARRSNTAMYAGGALVVVALGVGGYFMFGNKPTLDPEQNTGVQAPPVAPTGDAKAVADSIALANAQKTVSDPKQTTSAPPIDTAGRGGRATNPVAPTGGGGSQPREPLTEAEIQQLKRRVEAIISADSADPAQIRVALQEANRLILRASPTDSADILLERGTLQIAASREEEGCRDLRRARTIAAARKPELLRAVDFYFGAAKPCEQ